MALRRQHHEAVSDLCGRLFSEPGRLAERIAHPVEGRFRIAPHRHADVLQLDVLDRVSGQVFDGSGWTAVDGLSLLVHYPGDMHGYDVTGGRGSRMCHLKLRVGSGWPVTELRPWPRVAGRLPPMERLVSAGWEVAQHPMPGDERPPVLLSMLAMALSLWPGIGVSTAEAEAVEDVRDLAEAVRLVQQRSDNPPTVPEMASASHLSVRHFTRRFQGHFGCTPMQFVHAHRLDLAKTLLLGGRHGVSTVATRLGFSSHAAFTRWFRQHAGQAPSAFRNSPQSA